MKKAALLITVLFGIINIKAVFAADCNVSWNADPYFVYTTVDASQVRPANNSGLVDSAITSTLKPLSAIFWQGTTACNNQTTSSFEDKLSYWNRDANNWVQVTNASSGVKQATQVGGPLSFCFIPGYCTSTPPASPFNKPTVAGKYRMEFSTAGVLGSFPSTHPWYLNFWYTLASGLNISASGVLTGTLIIPNYPEMLSGTTPTYYLYIRPASTNPNPTIATNQNNAVLTDKNQHGDERLLPASSITKSNITTQDPYTMTISIDGRVTNLIPDTTYYWRLRQHGSSIDTYIPGGAFTFSPVISGVSKHPPVAFPTDHKIDISDYTNHIYEFTGDVTIDNPTNIISNDSKNTAVIFVDGNLNIGPVSGNRFTYGTANSGLVFVVKGNVNIDKTVTQIDAAIISEGIICTAYDATQTPACPTINVTTNPLVINGNLVSLNQTDTVPIKFRRNLANNATAAEQIVYQPKYLVILRNLLSDTYQKWSEINQNVPASNNTPPIFTPVTTVAHSTIAAPTPPPLPTTYKRMFVTSQTYDSNLRGSRTNGVAGANDKCQASADAANLGGSWIAWIASDTTTNAGIITNNAGKPMKLITGETVVNDAMDFFAALGSDVPPRPRLLHAINVDENSQRVNGGEAWTNIQAVASGPGNGIGVLEMSAGQKVQHTYSCNNWLGSSASGSIGWIDRTDSFWTEIPNQPFSCSSQARLYCFEI